MNQLFRITEASKQQKCCKELQCQNNATFHKLPAYLCNQALEFPSKKEVPQQSGKTATACQVWLPGNPTVLTQISKAVFSFYIKNLKNYLEFVLLPTIAGGTWRAESKSRHHKLGLVSNHFTDIMGFFHLPQCTEIPAPLFLRVSRALGTSSWSLQREGGICRNY